MPASIAEASTFTVAVANQAALQRLVVDVAMLLAPGDFVTLSGDLGAGKTTFARALIRYLADDPTMEVPSPTFNLIQSYDLPQFPVVHTDLYRVSGSAELAELGFDDLPERAIVLLEWPERAAGMLPPDRIDVTLILEPQRGLDYRGVRVTGHGTLAPRVERIATIRRFLQSAGFGAAERLRLQGDASTRLYERLVRDGHSYILMNAPRRPDGPPVRDGKPYSAIAHLAEDVVPFAAMAFGLRARGLSAPDIFAADLDRGLLLLEDLGEERVIAADPPQPIEECYAAAVDVLTVLHSHALPDRLPVESRCDYRLPHYDMGAQLIEAELLLDWYLPRVRARLSSTARAEFVKLWRDALGPVLAAPPTWVLRDFHSPNLLWLPEREGVMRIGLLDFQDAVMGPAAYDVASLLQDARVDVAEKLELALLDRYLRSRRDTDAAFEVHRFVEAYATVGAQRATKILGIFARLDLRDGKPQYLRHLPRIWAYLQRAFAHPSLAALRAWYETHVPAPSR